MRGGDCGVRIMCGHPLSLDWRAVSAQDSGTPRSLSCYCWEVWGVDSAGHMLLIYQNWSISKEIDLTKPQTSAIQVIPVSSNCDIITLFIKV